VKQRKTDARRCRLEEREREKEKRALVVALSFQKRPNETTNDPDLFLFRLFL